MVLTDEGSGRCPSKRTYLGSLALFISASITQLHSLSKTTAPPLARTKRTNVW